MDGCRNGKGVSKGAPSECRQQGPISHVTCRIAESCSTLVRDANLFTSPHVLTCLDLRQVNMLTPREVPWPAPVHDWREDRVRKATSLGSGIAVRALF